MALTKDYLVLVGILKEACTRPSPHMGVHVKHKSKTYLKKTKENGSCYYFCSLCMRIKRVLEATRSRLEIVIVGYYYYFFFFLSKRPIRRAVK